MSGQIVPVSEIVDHAHGAADAGRPITECPYPDNSPPADRWRVAYWARERELRSELEECAIKASG